MEDITREWVPVSGTLTEVLALPAKTDAPANLQVLIVPGNPGNAGFYRQFMRTLHKALGGRAHVVACSHIGHDPAHSKWGHKLWDLEDQIQHKVDFLKQHLLLPGRPPLVILAHSIGSYISVHAIHRLESALHHLRHHPPSSGTQAIHLDTRSSWDNAKLSSRATSLIPSHPQDPKDFVPQHHKGGERERWLNHLPHESVALAHVERVPPIAKVIALMPFFEANLPGQWRQRALHFLAHRYKTVSAMTAGLKALPVTVRMALVNMWTGGVMSKEAVHTTSRLLHPASIRNNFYLALHEFKQLAHPFQWDMLKRLGDRLHIMACPKDIWMSEEAYMDMHYKVPGIQASWHEGLQHAFCVSERECNEVTRHVVDVVLAPCLAELKRGREDPWDEGRGESWGEAVVQDMQQKSWQEGKSGPVTAQAEEQGVVEEEAVQQVLPGPHLMSKL